MDVEAARAALSEIDAEIAATNARRTELDRERDRVAAEREDAAKAVASLWLTAGATGKDRDAAAKRQATAEAALRGIDGARATLEAQLAQLAVRRADARAAADLAERVAGLEAVSAALGKLRRELVPLLESSFSGLGPTELVTAARVISTALSPNWTLKRINAVLDDAMADMARSRAQILGATAPKPRGQPLDRDTGCISLRPFSFAEPNSTIEVPAGLVLNLPSAVVAKAEQAGFARRAGARDGFANIEFVEPVEISIAGELRRFVPGRLYSLNSALADEAVRSAKAVGRDELTDADLAHWRSKIGSLRISDKPMPIVGLGFFDTETAATTRAVELPIEEPAAAAA